ncbi:MAG: type II secretion system protein [Candidatus Gracilibacteria bacterium]|nr:type II secretion system protein [Candidatus Gracilibacteria bacterium]
MDTQKTQTFKNVKGFTLVELIVVITILVILGTIAFLNLGGMSASARDSQRTSDLKQINDQIMMTQSKQGVSYISMTSSGANQLAATGAQISGTAATLGTEYVGGDINYTVLGLDSAKFQDPLSKVAYKMGATTLGGTAYEVSASLEESKTALVMGVYKPRTSTGSSANSATGTATVPTTGTLSVVIGSVDIGKLKLGDTLAGIAAGSGACAAPVKVTAVSRDMQTLSLSCSGTATAGTIAPNLMYIANAEVTGLTATGGTNVITNKGTNLPY